MKPPRWSVRFVDELQAVTCPVCLDMLELRRTTWEQPELKMQAHSAFQERHRVCAETGVAPTFAEKLWAAGMKRLAVNQ